MADKRAWIDWSNPSISIREQCELLGLNRSSLYYEPLSESPENLKLMRLIDVSLGASEGTSHGRFKEYQFVRVSW